MLSDTPRDINVVRLRVIQIAAVISTIANELNNKLKQTPGLFLDKKFDEQMAARIEPLNRELERLLEIKRQLENQKR